MTLLQSNNPAWLDIFNTVFNGLVTIGAVIVAQSWFREFIKRKRHDYGVGSYHINEDKIIKTLEDIKTETKANLVTLWGFQNGTYFTSDYGELKTKVMYQYPLPDDKTPNAVEEYKSVELWKFGRMFSKLQSCAATNHYYNEEHKYRDYQRATADHLKMNTYHVFKVSDKRIKNCDKQWKHTIIIGWDREVILSTDQKEFIESQINILEKYVFQ